MTKFEQCCHHDLAQRSLHLDHQDWFLLRARELTKHNCHGLVVEQGYGCIQLMARVYDSGQKRHL